MTSLPPLEPRKSQVTFKTVFTVCIGALAVYGLAVVVDRTTLALTLCTCALLIAVALHHVVDLLVRRRMQRGLAIASVVLIALGLLVALGFTIIPPAVSQANAFIDEVPTLIKDTRDSSWFQSIDARLHIAHWLGDLERQAPRLLEGAATVVSGVLSGVAAIVSVFVLAIFMLIFGPAFIDNVLAEALPANLPLYTKVLDKIYRSIGGYLGGLILICTINATVTTTFLAILGVPFFLPLGITSGASSLIPYAGPAVTGALVTVTAGATGGLWKGVACAIYFVIYGQIEGNILGPLIFRRTAHVNPLVVLLSITFFGDFAGIFGAVLAVPAAAAVQIILREVLRARRERLHMPSFPPSTSRPPIQSGPGDAPSG